MSTPAPADVERLVKGIGIPPRPEVLTRLQKEIERVSSDIARAESKLGNAGFLAKAPQNVVDEEKGKLSLAQDMLAKLHERLETLN